MMMITMPPLLAIAADYMSTHADADDADDASEKTIHVIF
jgi:hypothetical protein